VNCRLAALLLAALASGARAGDIVRLRPGDDIQAAVDAAPPGTTFRLEAGVYRRQRVMPKDAQSFVGMGDVVLDGSIVLEGWLRRGEVWEWRGLPAALPSHGDTREGRQIAKRREDLFVDGALYRRVATREELGPGTWHEEAGTAILSDSPEGKLVELGQAGPAFAGAAVGVRIEKLTVRKYATDAQEGAIDGRVSRGWQVFDVASVWNHGAGLHLGDGMLIERGRYSDNGQLGVRGGGPLGGHGASIDGAEIAGNNFAGYSPWWEAGGVKLLQLSGVAVRRTMTERNDGTGLWVDWDNREIEIDENCVRDNAGIGIQYEASQAGKIRRNRALRNGTDGYRSWLWGAAILVQNSSAVEVSDNLVVVDRGNGLAVIHQDRSGGAFGPHVTRENLFLRNTVAHLRPGGRNGMVADAQRGTLTDASVWDLNTYVVAEPWSTMWMLGRLEYAAATFDAVQRRGYERHGRVSLSDNPAAEVAPLLDGDCQ
jgi:hypothetical protein